MTLKNTVKPFGDRVAILPLSEEEVRASGIVVVTNNNKDRAQQGIVLAAGELVEGFTQGDRVLFGPFAGDAVRVQDTEGKYVEIKVLHADSVLGTIV